MRKDAWRDTQRQSTKLVERVPWTTSNYATKKFSSTSLLQTIFCASISWKHVIYCMYVTLYFLLRLLTSVQVRDKHHSSLGLEKRQLLQEKAKIENCKKRKAECSSKRKNVLPHMGQLSLSIPAWYKD